MQSESSERRVAPSGKHQKAGGFLSVCGANVHVTI
jgi:hypothetical protein